MKGIIHNRRLTGLAAGVFALVFAAVAPVASAKDTYPPGWNTKTINPPRSQSRSVPSWGTSTDGSAATATALLRAPGPETPDRASGGGAHARRY